MQGLNNKGELTLGSTEFETETGLLTRSDIKIAVSMHCDNVNFAKKYDALNPDKMTVIAVIETDG